MRHGTEAVSYTHLSLHADNVKVSQVLQGSIDLFALPGDEAMFDQVQKALNEAEISFYFSSAQFEDLELNDFMHYEWVFELSLIHILSPN